MVTSGQLLIGLEVAVLIMVMILLYHALFVVVDLRKIMRRFSELTKEVEDMIMKPLSIIDTVLEWTLESLEESMKPKKKSKKKKKK